MSSDPRPPHQQLADRLRADIAAGRLVPGDRLPSVRRLAETHGLAPGTVQQAITALQRDGLVVTARGKGTTVIADAVDVPPTVEELVETVRELSHRVEAVESELRVLKHRKNAT
jgi:GntR family transcriptional regulator